MAGRGYWIGWMLMASAATAYLGFTLASGGDETFLPGRTTDGHYQIEVKCAACHTPFTKMGNEPCLACHGDDLAEAEDAHPRSKFTDPRNADLVNRLDAMTCVTCHREHRPSETGAMGVTLPIDYCGTCHADVGQERPTHRDLPFDTCASAACHNFHDNRALYEDFLVAHASEGFLQDSPLVARRHLASARVDPRVPDGWTTDAHLEVACAGCHQAAEAESPAWVERPDHRACEQCHGGEGKGFLAGRHGMRLALDLPPMTPALARLPMKASAAGLTLSCSSCHAPHRYDTVRAAADACLACHDDGHSTAYLASPHYALWQRETSGAAESGTGVSCATCHLPRERRREAGAEVVRVDHNQNHNLQPNEKMVRSVCLTCHGLGFSLDALADAALVAANFTGRPTRHVNSIEMAADRAPRASSN